MIDQISVVIIEQISIVYQTTGLINKEGIGQKSIMVFRGNPIWLDD